MYKKIENYFSFKDERGEILGLINFDSWEEINHIKSFKDSIRGGHYHKNTIEGIIVLKGSIKADFIKGNKKDNIYLKAGDVIIIEPEVLHTFTMLEDSEWLNLLSIRNNPKSPDIFK